MVFHVGKADHMSRRFAFRILPLVFLALVDPLDVERRNFLAHRLVDLPLDPDESLVFVLQLLVEVFLCHAEQLGNLPELGAHGWIVTFDVLRDRPNARRRHARRQDQPIAIEDASAIGRQRQRAFESHHALTFVKIVIENLYVGSAHAQPDEPERDTGHDELAAPDRRLAGQERTGRVLHAAIAHGLRPTRGAEATVMAGNAEPGAIDPSAPTYWVMAGVGVRMES